MEVRSVAAASSRVAIVPSAADAAPNVPVLKKKTSGGLSLGLSISGMMNEANTKIAEKERSAQFASENKAFTNDDLKKAWTEYQNRIPEKVILLSAMKSYDPVLLANNQVEVVVDNEIQKRDLENELPDLLTFISNQLHNGAIRIKVRMSEIGENKMVLDPQERLMEMIGRNARIADLKNALGLEID